jgi:hypothetical protein
VFFGSGQMNVQDVFKFQALSNMGKPGVSMYDILLQILMMIVIGIMDDLAKMLPAVIKYFQERASSRVRSALTSAVTIVSDCNELCTNAIMLDKRHAINNITMMRVYVSDRGEESSRSSSSSSDPTEMNLMVDAILAHVSRLDNIPSFCLIPNGNFMVSYKDKHIQITKEIFMKIDEITTDPKTGNVVMIRITLSSNTLSASDITNFVQTIYISHQEQMKNSLGKNIYFFDQKIKDVPPPPFATDTQNKRDILNHRRMVVQTAPKQLAFTMSQFYSNKRFGNIFGTDVRKVQRRVEFFANNREWYDEKGIPYQLGIMLSGLPGTGKTSLIRAIANMTKRHIVNVNFASITTASQLKNLFYNDKIVVYTDTSLSDTKSYYIPIDQRLYVLEEIDAVGDILKQRRSDPNANDGGSDQNETIPDELTLGEILTVLDGTMEVPGRMIIMTSNHPEVLDRALLRPGRIDLNVRFENATRELIAEMYEAYLETPFPNHRIMDLPDGCLTPAEVSEVIMKYCKTDFDSDQVINDICKGLKNKIENEESVMENPQNVTETFPKCSALNKYTIGALSQFSDFLLKTNCYRVDLDDVLCTFMTNTDDKVLDEFFEVLRTNIKALEKVADQFPGTMQSIVQVIMNNMIKGIAYPKTNIAMEEGFFDHIIVCADALGDIQRSHLDVTDITIHNKICGHNTSYMKDILNTIQSFTKETTKHSSDDFFKDSGLAPFQSSYSSCSEFIPMIGPTV